MDFQLAAIGLLYVYVAITGDEYGEKLVPLTQQISTYPYGPPPYDPSKYGNNTNIANNEENDTLPNKINVTTSRQQQQPSSSSSDYDPNLPPPRWWFGTSANAVYSLYDTKLTAEEE